LKFANDETTIAQLKDRIAKTIDYLKSVKQSEIEGTEGKDISITFPHASSQARACCSATASQTSGFTSQPHRPAVRR
jgi:hypothetical protein